MHARLDHGKVQLPTRTGTIGQICSLPVSALRGAAGKTAYIAANFARYAPTARHRFGLLQAAMDQGTNEQLVFFAFDLLYLDGKSMRRFR